MSPRDSKKLPTKSLITSINDFVSHNLSWFAIFFVTYFVCFYFGTHFLVFDKVFGTQVHLWYSSWQVDSDQLLYGRLFENFQSGVFSQMGQLWIPSKSAYYESQFGFGGWALSLIPFTFGLQGLSGIKLMYGIVSCMSALLMTFFTVQIKNRVSKGATLLFMFVMLQPYAVGTLHSIYMMFWLKAIPAIALIYIFQKKRETTARVFLILVVCSIPGFLSGYEYLTLYVSLQWSVIAFFAIRDSWNTKRILNNSIVLLGASFVTLAISLLVHLSQLALIHGGFKKGLDYMIWDLTVRLGVTDMNVDPVFLDSLQAQPLSLLYTYLKLPVLMAPLEIDIVSGFTVLTLILVASLAILYISKNTFNLKRENGNQPILNGLAGAWIVGLIGPLTWYLLARPHSFIHIWINNFMWFFPTIPLGVILINESIRLKILDSGKRNDVRSTMKVLLLMTVALVLISYIYSVYSMRA